MALDAMSPEEMADAILGYKTGRCFECSGPLGPGHLVRKDPENVDLVFDCCLPCDIRANPDNYPEGELARADEDYRDWRAKEIFWIVEAGGLRNRLIAIESALLDRREEEAGLSNLLQREQMNRIAPMRFVSADPPRRAHEGTRQTLVIR